MQDDKNNTALTLISQYGDEAEAIAMLRAAEYAAAFDTDNWMYWEQIILEIQKLNENPSLDG